MLIDFKVHCYFQKMLWYTNTQNVESIQIHFSFWQKKAFALRWVWEYFSFRNIFFFSTFICQEEKLKGNETLNHEYKVKPVPLRVWDLDSRKMIKCILSPIFLSLEDTQDRINFYLYFPGLVLLVLVFLSCAYFATESQSETIAAEKLVGFHKKLQQVDFEPVRFLPVR